MAEQNNLSLLNFKFKLDGAPNLEPRVQNVVVPGMELGTAAIPTPFVQLADPGNLSYSPLQVTFMVGENMKDYLEIFNWMVGLGYPDQLGQYQRKLKDGNVLILDSSYKTVVNVRFHNLYPISISDLNFDSTLSEIQYATATISFNFDRFYFEPTT